MTETDASPSDERANARRWMCLGLKDLRGAASVATEAAAILLRRAEDLETRMELLDGRDPLLDVTAALNVVLEALHWCSGNAAFGPGGEARQGWERIVMPAMRTGRDALRLLDGRGPTDGGKADA